MPVPSAITPGLVRQVKDPYDRTVTFEQMSLLVFESKRLRPFVFNPKPVPDTTIYEPPALPTSGLIERKLGVSCRKGRLLTPVG